MPLLGPLPAHSISLLCHAIHDNSHIAQYSLLSRGFTRQPPPFGHVLGMVTLFHHCIVTSVITMILFAAAEAIDCFQCRCSARPVATQLRQRRKSRQWGIRSIGLSHRRHEGVYLPPSPSHACHGHHQEPPGAHRCVVCRHCARRPSTGASTYRPTCSAHLFHRGEAIDGTSRG